MKKKNKIEAMTEREFQLYTDRVERTFTATLYAAVILVFAAIVATWLYILPQYELWRAGIDEKVEQIEVQEEW